MKKLVIVIFAVAFLASCKKKDLECDYLYTDDASGLAERGTAIVCTKCSKKQREKAEKELKSSDGYSEISCDEQ